MALHVFYSDLYTIPLPADHRFPMHKYRALREALGGDSRFEFEPSPLALREEVELAHHPDYVRRFLEGGLTRAEIRRIGFPWSEALVKRTLASAGGTLAAARRAWREGCSGALAGGTHHAFYAEGSGYCVFNDIAIGILSLREEGRIQRAAVVDLDVHQGDGTASIFEDDPTCLPYRFTVKRTFLFGSRFRGGTWDCVTRLGDETYLETLERELPGVFDFHPQIVFFQAGVDGLETDRLGRLALTHAGLTQRDQLVLNTCKSKNIPVVITIGGGYSDPIEPTIEAHANTFRTAASMFA